MKYSWQGTHSLSFIIHHYIPLLPPGLEGFLGYICFKSERCFFVCNIPFDCSAFSFITISVLFINVSRICLEVLLCESFLAGNLQASSVWMYALLSSGTSPQWCLCILLLYCFVFSFLSDIFMVLMLLMLNLIQFHCCLSTYFEYCFHLLIICLKTLFNFFLLLYEGSFLPSQQFSPQQLLLNGDAFQ